MQLWKHGIVLYKPVNDNIETDIHMAENMTKLQIYVESAHPQVYEELDFPLYKDFKNHATETLS